MLHLLPSRPVRRILVAVFMGFIGCAPAVHPPISPAPWSEYEVETVTMLMALEDRRAFNLEALASAVASPSPTVRARAALSALRTAPIDGRPLLRLLLADEDTAVAAVAAFATGLAGDTAAVERLVPLLRDSSGSLTVALEAAAALGRIATPGARTTLRDLLLSADTLGRGAGPELIAEALIAAWRAGEEAIEPFARWTSHPAGEVRWSAAYALTRPYRPGAAARLEALLSDAVPLVRATAVRGLALPAVVTEGSARAAALDALLPLLDDPAYPVRIEAIRALGTYDDPAAVEALVNGLGTGPAHESITALESLARIGPAAAPASPRLQELLFDSAMAGPIREQSLRALAAVDSTAFRSIEEGLARDADWRLRSALGTVLASLSTEPGPLLRSLARDRDPRVAARTVAAMVESLPREALVPVRPLFIELLLTSDVHVRAAALDALAALADPTTFPAILDAYDVAQRDVENDAALSALDAIAEMRASGVPSNRAFFARFPRHGDYLVRLRAQTHFGAVALNAWGPALPIEVGRTEQTYREFVSRWMAEAVIETDRPRVAIQSESGTIEIELFAEETPLTVDNFLELARIGYFDGQQWPRVVPNFVVQGGDPRGDTSGGPGYSIRDELNRHRFRTGSVGMALSGPDTGGSQFFITHSPQPHLDGGYTVFGRVLNGQDVVERILPGERILSVRIIDEDVDE